MHLAKLTAASKTSKRGQQQRELAEAKRLKQHHENEANRPEDSRLMTRKDLDDHAVRFVCTATLSAYASLIRWFENFVTTVLSQPLETAQHYFERGGPLPTVKVIRQFFFYLSDGGTGIHGGKLARRTTESYAASFFGALQYTNKLPERETREQTYLWIRYNLTEELGLQKQLVVSKPIAYAEDVTLILSKLYSPLGLRGCMSMRIVLNMSLFINLMVDACGRAHELISARKYPELYLTWQNIKIYVFKNKRGEVEFAGTVRLTNLKGLKDRPEKWKEMPLKLLPTQMCFEDSLRLLIFAALIDGRFPNARTWEELEENAAACATESGRLLPFTPESMNLPVMPSVSHVTSEVLYEKPMNYDCVRRQLYRLGKLCGFKQRLKSHAFRRGCSNALEASCNPQQLNFIMGHSPNSTSYWKHYKSNTSTMDVQNIIRGRAPEDVRRMSSMSLDRSVGGGPLAISPAGADSVTSDPLFQEALRDCDKAFDNVTDCFGTLEEAEKSAGPEWRAYLEAVRNRKRTTKRLVNRVRNREYNESVNSATIATSEPADQHYIGELGHGPSEEAEAEDPDFFAMEPLTQFVKDFSLADKVMEPLLLNPHEFNKRLTSLSSSEKLDEEDEVEVTSTDGEGDTDGRLEKIKLPQPAPATSFLSTDIDSIDFDPTMQAMDDESDRSHGLYRYSRRQGCATGSYYETHALRPHSFDDLYSKVTSSDSELSNHELAEDLLPIFKTMHPLERYGVNLAPEPGTMICGTCHEDMESELEYEQHATGCRAASAQAAAEQMWTQAVRQAMAEPCSWQSYPTRRCGKEFDDIYTFVKHIMGHTRRKAEAVCRFGQCPSIHQRPEIPTREEWNEHLAQEHGLTCATTPSDAMFFCSFCDNYVLLGLAGPSIRRNHYQGHIIDALDSARQYGYNEVRSEVGGQLLLSARLPWLCIFCLHNQDLPADQRLSNGSVNQVVFHNTTQGRIEHLEKHLHEIQEPIHCPASGAAGAEKPLCRSSARFDAHELSVHLIKVHRIFDAEILQDRRQAARERQAAKEVANKIYEDDSEKAQNKAGEAKEVLTEKSTNVPPRKKKA